MYKFRKYAGLCTNKVSYPKEYKVATTGMENGLEGEESSEAEYKMPVFAHDVFYAVFPNGSFASTMSLIQKRYPLEIVFTWLVTPQK